MQQIFQNNSVHINPNPVKDKMEVSGLKAGSIIQLTDVTGKILMTQTATETTVLNLSAYNAGIYFLKTQTSIQKIVKQ